MSDVVLKHGDSKMIISTVDVKKMLPRNTKVIHNTLNTVKLWEAEH